MINDGPMAMAYINTQWVAGGMLVPGRGANNKGMIALVNFVVFELYIQSAMRGGGAGKKHHATGRAIEAMNDPNASKFGFKGLNQGG